ncbi:hypothetical protein [Microbacterium aoyamense]|nr:hypothetical protein [Microbacterium aoyamense]
MVAMNFLASACLTGLAIVLIWVSFAERNVWLLLPTFAAALVGLWMMFRAPLMRVSFDSESLHIVGLFRSRRIRRSAVLSVERSDLDLPMVQWAGPGSPDKWSVMTPLMLGSSAFLPASMYRRRHRFLASLRLWAPDATDNDVRPGWWSRLLDVFAAALAALLQSPALRILAAITALMVAAAVYWFGWVSLADVIHNDVRYSRGLTAAVFVVAAAAETGYWLAPLRKRHPLLWHIALAVVVAPLAALTLVAVFT